jgi:carbonic anhydrase
MKKLCALLTLAQALSATTPQEALNRLVEGNRHYIHDNLKNLDQDSYRRQEVAAKQKPFAVIVGCSDSRVPPEIIFDQGLGDLFVVRVAGQVVGGIELDSVDFGIHVLGASLILVLGHEACGAVKAVLEGNVSEIRDVANLIQPAVKDIPPTELEKGIKANVRWTVDSLKKTPLIKKYIKEGKVRVIGGYYHLSDGQVELLK